ncbi:hypothetical protein AB0H77_26805 [Streptomyces sp. NPDC050844]|uniref:hypothetical protein n=1 Tax=Streptomyces sp. NPDC050844 TaxID=3155790 RepID=UPI0034048734
MHAYEELTSAERQLWNAHPTGGSVDFRTGGPEDDPEHGNGWGDARTVRASVVGALLLGGNPGQPGSVPALWLAGARISGTLDLSEAEIGHGMWFDGCWFEQGVRLYGAATRTIEIKGSRLPGLDLTMARVEGRVAFRHTVLNGRLGLMNARLAGELVLSDSVISRPGAWAVVAGGLVMEGGLFCRTGRRHGAGLRAHAGRSLRLHPGGAPVGADGPAGRAGRDHP